MPEISLPPFLISSKSFERLIKLLLEKAALKRTIEAREFGPRVFQEEEAGRLLTKIREISHGILRLDPNAAPLPKLILTKQLSDLPRQTVRSYLFFGPLSVLLLLLGLTVSPGGASPYLVLGATLFILAVPLLLHRRTRLHVEHGCRYGTDKEGQGVILIDQLPRIQFQSYLAHEYAHHLYALLKKDRAEGWIREGWARLLQWQVANRLYDDEKDPAYLHHVLAQIIGELKFACQIIAALLHTKLPSQARRIRTIYHRNPLFTLLTGTPMSMVNPLLEHAIGTAAYLMMAEKSGLRAALNENPDTWFENPQKP